MSVKVRIIPTVKDVKATFNVGMMLMNFVRAFLYDCLTEDLNLSSPLLMLPLPSFLAFSLSFSSFGSMSGSFARAKDVVVTNSLMNCLFVKAVANVCSLLKDDDDDDDDDCCADGTLNPTCCFDGMNFGGGT